MVCIQVLNCNKFATFKIGYSDRSRPAHCMLLEGDRAHRKQVNCQSAHYIEIQSYLMY